MTYPIESEAGTSSTSTNPTDSKGDSTKATLPSTKPAAPKAGANQTAPSAQYIFRTGKPSEADASAISHLVRTTWAEANSHSVSASDLETHLNSLSPAHIARDLGDENHTFVLAFQSRSLDASAGPSGEEVEAEGELVGVAQIIRNATPEPCLQLPNPIKLSRLYVHHSAHGSGLAQRLLSRTEDTARSQGAGSIWLGVWENNARGIRFYEKHRFVEKGEHWFFAGQARRRDLVMEKAL